MPRKPLIMGAEQLKRMWSRPFRYTDVTVDIPYNYRQVLLNMFRCAKKSPHWLRSRNAQPLLKYFALGMKREKDADAVNLNRISVTALAHAELFPSMRPFCWIDRYGLTRCLICGGQSYDDGIGGKQRHCGREWCQRLHTFYYVEGRNRPSTVRGVKNKELKFDLLLSDYLRRYANEQARSQHSWAAGCPL